jgi:methylmalonyl-CoA/ethylmalonyl-CoA epimerase
MTASKTGLATSHDLAYVALASRDINAAIAVLGDALGLPRHEVASPAGGKLPVFAVGRSALILFEAGDPFLSHQRTGVDHIALAANAPDSTAADCGMPTLPAASASVADGRQVVLDPAATCGVATRFATPLGLPSGASPDIERIDHLGIASADNVAAEAAFVARIGCTYESRQTDMEVSQAIESFTSDKYGVVYHARAPVPVGGLRVSFITVGDCELEFLQNFDPAQGFEIKHGTPGDTKQDQSAIGRYVERHGPGLHHIALKCRDINALLPRLAAAGCRMIDLAGRPGSRRARIGFMHPSSLGGILLHFVEREDI